MRSRSSGKNAGGIPGRPQGGQCRPADQCRWWDCRGRPGEHPIGHDRPRRNVALRGSTNFTVLIDGKPSLLTGSDALQQIPASTIDKIEIITNPSAKFDPDGTAGIINIVTKKNSLNGLSGIANLTAGSSPEISGDITLNYRTKKPALRLAPMPETGRWRDTGE